MKIACLGWGSLIWKSEELPLASEWHSDGPVMPVEFSRVRNGGELATAICLNAPSVQVYWAMLESETLQHAVSALHKRESIPVDRVDGVGKLIVQQMPYGPLTQWALERKIDAVIWTALPPRLNGVEGLIPSVEDALVYLSSLEDEKREHAFNYLRRVPAQFDTPYRRVFNERLNLAR